MTTCMGCVWTCCGKPPALYLDLAYPAGVVPEVVRRRLDWREDCPADELLAGPPFERAGKAPGGRRRSMRCGWGTTAIRT